MGMCHSWQSHSFFLFLFFSFFFFFGSAGDKNPSSCIWVSKWSTNELQPESDILFESNRATAEYSVVRDADRNIFDFSNLGCFLMEQQ
jgi:hypothetical protein